MKGVSCLRQRQCVSFVKRFSFVWSRNFMHANEITIIHCHGITHFNFREGKRHINTQYCYSTHTHNYLIYRHLLTLHRSHCTTKLPKVVQHPPAHHSLNSITYFCRKSTVVILMTLMVDFMEPSPPISLRFTSLQQSCFSWNFLWIVYLNFNEELLIL